MLKNQPVASKNIYDQQIQLADFLHKYYRNAKVVANDIGAITYFNNIHLLDTYGLGSIEVAKLRKGRSRQIYRQQKTSNLRLQHRKVGGF